MKIVHIMTNFGAGGIEHFVTQAAIRQTAQHKVCVIALRHPNGSSDRALDHKRSLEAAGIEVHVAQDFNGMGMLGMAFGMHRLLRMAAPDVVNAHSFRALLLRALVGGGMIGQTGKWIYTHHTAPVLVRPLLFRLLDACVTRYIANSKAGAQNLKDHTKKPVDVIYHGVLFRDAPKPPCLPIENAGFVVMTVGSLRPEKRHDRILKIAANLRDMAPEVFARTVFKIAGEGPCRADLRRGIEQLELWDHVQLLGERSDVLALLHTSDVFLLTSEFEGVPISLVEAGWAGLPIISADVGGCSEVFKDNCEGYLVNDDDIGGYTTAIQRLATNDVLRQRMSKAAQMIPDRFNMSSCIDQTNRIYQATQGK